MGFCCTATARLYTPHAHGCAFGSVSLREDACDQSLCVSFASAQIVKLTNQEKTHDVRKLSKTSQSGRNKKGIMHFNTDAFGDGSNSTAASCGKTPGLGTSQCRDTVQHQAEVSIS